MAEEYLGILPGTQFQDGPFPTILETHGGPTWVMSSLYWPTAQCWLDHGFAFFSLNYHGSTTFGKAFEESIRGNIGDLEVQDMAAACKWLVDNKIASITDGTSATTAEMAEGILDPGAFARHAAHACAPAHQ